MSEYEVFGEENGKGKRSMYVDQGCMQHDTGLELIWHQIDQLQRSLGLESMAMARNVEVKEGPGGKGGRLIDSLSDMARSFMWSTATVKEDPCGLVSTKTRLFPFYLKLNGDFQLYRAVSLSLAPYKR